MRTIHKTIQHILMIALIMLFMISACSGSTNGKESYKIGVVNLAPAFDPILEGFKAGLEEAGYVEGQDLTFIYDGPAATPDALDGVLEKLKNENVDLVLTFGTLATLKAKESLSKTDIPIIFGPVTDPVASGIVADVLHQGENVTGIQTGNPTPKRLEWLLKIDPGIKRLYTFNNPDDNSSVQTLAALKETAPIFNVELVIRDTTTQEEITAALNAMPEDIDAIFLPASAFFERNNDQFVKFSNEHKLPLAAPATANVLDGALTSFGHDNIPLGKQASHLADQILSGVDPADLPIESADLFVSINLKTAEIIELSIPDEIIRQVNIIVR